MQLRPGILLCSIFSAIQQLIHYGDETWICLLLFLRVTMNMVTYTLFSTAAVDVSKCGLVSIRSPCTSVYPFFAPVLFQLGYIYIFICALQWSSHYIFNSYQSVFSGQLFMYGSISVSQHNGIRYLCIIELYFRCKIVILYGFFCMGKFLSKN